MRFTRLTRPGCEGDKMVKYLCAIELIADYRRDQWLAPEQIAALQWERLKRLLEHCHREVPYYRRRWRELGITPAVILNLDDYALLPVLT